jgi:alkylation response protein AidB-like acyl-CoA dehydrogenase
VTVEPDRRDEWEALRAVARRVLEKESSSARVRAVANEPLGYDGALWRTMAEMGWTGLAMPEAHGGAGYGFAEMSIVLQELGRHVTPSPFLSTAVLGAGVLLVAAGEGPGRELLPQIAAGDLRTAVVARFVSETSVPTVHRTSRGYVLEGRAAFVLDGCGADLLLVVSPSADGSGGAELFAVPASAAGVSRHLLPTIDMTRRLCDVTFDEVALPVDARVGRAGDERALVSWLIDRAAAALAADSVGGAERVLEMSVDYAKARVQFGRPIGTFQAIKHKCADMLLLVEASRVAAEEAAARSPDRPGEPSPAAAIAKSYACDAYAKVAGDSIQLHGGIGFTWEHDIHLFFKRAKLNQALFGDSSWHLARLADLLLVTANDGAG